MAKKTTLTMAATLAMAAALSGCRTTNTTETGVKVATPTNVSCFSEAVTGVNSLPSVSDFERRRKSLAFDSLIADVLSERSADALQLNFECIANVWVAATDGPLKVYTFDPPNDFYEVVMVDGNYPHVLCNKGSISPCFGCPSGVESFYGLTQNYLLSLESDGSVIAIAYEWDYSIREIGASPIVRVPFEELPEEEKESAIYPNGFYWCSFPEPTT